MTDTLSISCTPSNEECVQVSQEVDYLPMMAREVRAFKAQLERESSQGKYGKQGNAYFKVVRNPHDLGVYYDVVVVFNENCDIQVEFAMAVEGNFPGDWDEEAKKELGPEYFEFIKKQKSK